MNGWNIFQHFQGFFDGQIEQIGNRESLVAYRQGLGVVTFAATDLASNINIRQEIHFDATLAVALASLASSTLHVETKTSGLVTAFAGFGQHRIQFPDRSEDSRISGGIRARRAADGCLIDLNHLVDMLDAGNRAMRARFFHGAVQILRQRTIQNVIDQRGFSGAGDAGNDRQ